MESQRGQRALCFAQRQAAQALGESVAGGGVCGLLFPTGMVMGCGPSGDKGDAPELLEKSMDVPLDALPQKLCGDAGYDADWLHARCREEHGVEAIVRPATCRADGTLGGTCRRR